MKKVLWCIFAVSAIVYAILAVLTIIVFKSDLSRAPGFFNFIMMISFVAGIGSLIAVLASKIFSILMGVIGWIGDTFGRSSGGSSYSSSSISSRPSSSGGSSSSSSASSSGGGVLSVHEALEAYEKIAEKDRRNS